METFVCLFVCNRGDTIQYHGGLRSRELGQAPMLLVFQLLGRRYHLTRVNRWSDYIGYRISTILQHFTHTMKLSDPLLLADGTMHSKNLSEIKPTLTYSSKHFIVKYDFQLLLNLTCSFLQTFNGP